MTVTVEDEIFGRKVEPLRNKLTLERKLPEPKSESGGSGGKASQREKMARKNG